MLNVLCEGNLSQPSCMSQAADNFLSDKEPEELSDKIYESISSNIYNVIILILGKHSNLFK